MMAASPERRGDYFFAGAAMAKSYNVAVVGATGVVGQEFLRILAQRRFPLRSLKLIASPRSAGTKMLFGEHQIEVEALTHRSFDGCDLAFISATDEVSREYAPAAVKAGAVVIDDSGAWRMDPEVPPVIPEVDGEDVAKHKGIRATPNCATTPIVLTLWPIHKVNRVQRVIAATYQSVSGTGRAAGSALERTRRRGLAGEAGVAHAHPHQLAFNLIPEAGAS